MQFDKIIYLRAEISKNELRTPLVPRDVATLVQAGFTVFVESCKNHRIYLDQEYSNLGIQVTNKPWYSDEFPKNTLILGIKGGFDLTQLSQHKHAYFSHSFGNQEGSADILKAFVQSKSQLYDLEFVTDQMGKRMLAFGERAGQMAAGLGIYQYFYKTVLGKDVQDLQPWTSELEFMQEMTQYTSNIPKNVKIAVMGKNGRCGRGVCQFLDKMGFSYVGIDKNHTTSLSEYDIIYNCILLGNVNAPLWLSVQDAEYEIQKPTVLVDVSCDVSKPNHPFRELYVETTSWKTPVKTVGPYLDIIAIDNLPSLLPRESSDDFSRDLTQLLLSEDLEPWKSANQVFLEQSLSI